MPKNRFTEEQIVRILRETEVPGAQVREVGCAGAGSEAASRDRAGHRHPGRMRCGPPSLCTIAGAMERLSNALRSWMSIRRCAERLRVAGGWRPRT
jgi:hypothetical protein